MTLDDYRHPRWLHNEDRYEDEQPVDDSSEQDLEAAWQRSFAAARKLDLAAYPAGHDDQARVDTRCFDRDQHADEWRTPPDAA